MTPPLLSGKGDQLMVLGFYSLARRALLEPLMRFGVPVVGGLGGLHTLFLEVGRTCGHKHALPRGWTGSPCICAHLQEQAAALLNLPAFLTGMQALLVTCSRPHCLQALPGAPRAQVIQYCNLVVNVLSSAGAALGPSAPGQPAEAHILRGLEPAILGEISRYVVGDA